MRARFEVADVFRKHSDHLAALTQNLWQCRTLQAIADCRTPALGGHIDKCDNPACKSIHISYNSCRNRHCPKCQGHKREEWISARERELLKVPYYHLVFTLPEELNPLCMRYKRELYALLFKTAWSVVQDFSANHKFIGAKPGMISILHTWGQNLSYHPHLHCIVPGGGVSSSGKWKHARAKDKFLFPVKAMSKVFRARFIQNIRQLKEPELPQKLAKQLFSKDWIVYCKRPFFGPQQVIEYLGRYTHKVAISNHRIQHIEDGKVTFTAKDYRHGGKKILLTLSEQEFIRRFSMHVLPKGFVRMRHYGILSSALKKTIIPLLQEALGEVVLKRTTKMPHRACPLCKTGKLTTILYFKGRAPPEVPIVRGGNIQPVNYW